MSEETTKALEAAKIQLADLKSRRELVALQRQVARMESDLTQGKEPTTIETISDFLGMVMNEKAELRDGLIDTEKARINAKLNQQILKAAELNIQYARLHRGKQPASELRLIEKSTA